MKQIKLDLHTHSILSNDGGITANQYEQVLKKGLLDFIAITDHNEIEFAKKAHRNLGSRIIVGEEIRTNEGDVISLFLKEKIDAGLSLSETVKRIKKQNALVYIPHPFDPKRSSVTNRSIGKIINEVDIIEVFNARNLWPRIGRQAKVFAQKFNLPGSAGSDAHCVSELGQTYAVINTVPIRKNLIRLLKNAKLETKSVNLGNYLSPKINIIKKWL